jgi:hypothetical protein
MLTNFKVDFLGNSEFKWFTGGFFLPNTNNIFNFSIGTILQWSTLGYCNLNTYENEEVAFIRQTSGEPLKWRQFDEISKDTISKIKYTALFQNLKKPSLKSSSLKSSSHLWLCKSTTTGWYLLDSAIKSKQDGKIWPKMFSLGGKGNKMYYI